MTGLSGDSVHMVVHKVLGGGDSERLHKLWGEMGKQQVLAHLGIGPPVLQATPFEYVRPYVPGVTLEDHLEEHPEEAEDRAHELLGLWEVLGTAAAPGSTESMRDYASRVMRENAWAYVSAGLMGSYGDLLQAIERTTWPYPEQGFSHGDLNFENIIVDPDGHLHLIDPLLNAYETPWWDIGKLLQSTHVHWWGLRQGIVVTPPDYLQQMAKVFLAGRRQWGLFFLFLVLLRILRHAPSDEVRNAVLAEAFRTGWEYVRAS